MRLNTKVPVVILQFHFGKRSSVPAGIPTLLPPETAPEKKRRLTRQGSGKLIIGPQNNSTVVNLPEGLCENGYTVVGVRHEERLNDNRPGAFQVVQVTFHRREASDRMLANLADQQAEKALSRACEGLRELCVNNFWRARVYDNPFFRQGEPVEGLRCAVVVCDMKRPTVQGNGEPVLVWQKD